MTLPDQQGPDQSDAPVASSPCIAAIPPVANLPRTPIEMLHAAAGGVRSVWKHLSDLGEAEYFAANRVPYSLVRRLDEVLARVKQESAARAMGRPPADPPIPEGDASRQHIAGLMADVLTEVDRAMACPADAPMEREQAARAMFNQFEVLLAAIPIEQLDAGGLDVANKTCIGLLARLAPYSHPGLITIEQSGNYQAAADRITQRFLVIQRDNVRFAIDTGRGFDEILAGNPRQSVRRLARDVGWRLRSLQQRREFYLAVGELTDEEIDEVIDLAVQHGILGAEMFPNLDELQELIVVNRHRITGHPAPMDRRVANARSGLRASTRT